MTTVRISTTGVAHGSGSDQYRYVSYLSPEDKAAIQAGQIVAVPRIVAGQRHGNWYIVTGPHNGRYGHRLPTLNEAKLIESLVRGEDIIP